MDPKRTKRCGGSPAKKSAKSTTKKYQTKNMPQKKAAIVRRALHSSQEAKLEKKIAAFKDGRSSYRWCLPLFLFCINSRGIQPPKLIQRPKKQLSLNLKELLSQIMKKTSTCRPAIITVENSVIKGYHCYKRRPPVTNPVTKLLVQREYNNIHDKNACLVSIPDISSFDESLHDMWTDEEALFKLSDIAGKPVGHVPRILASCFALELYSGGQIYAIVTGDPMPSFSPWPAQFKKGGGIVIPCNYLIMTDDRERTIALLRETLIKMKEGDAMKVVVNA